MDSNFIDDVGQTLLNWCAAFGTPDMVMYLCDKGADPNKGQRSSSLHYAACFGRPEVRIFRGLFTTYVFALCVIKLCITLF